MYGSMYMFEDSDDRNVTFALYLFVRLISPGQRDCELQTTIACSKTDKLACEGFESGSYDCSQPALFVCKIFGRINRKLFVNSQGKFHFTYSFGLILSTNFFDVVDISCAPKYVLDSVSYKCISLDTNNTCD